MSDDVTDALLSVTTATQTLNPGQLLLQLFTKVPSCVGAELCTAILVLIYTTYNVTAVPGSEVSKSQTRAAINRSRTV